MGMGTREADMVKHLLVADTHDSLLLFTSRGKVYRLRCYDISQDASRTTKGTALVNLLPVDSKERVTALVVAKDSAPDSFMIMATSRGIIKKTSFDKFASVRSNGLIAMKLRGDEELIGADIVAESGEVVLISKKGQAVRFAATDLRSASRVSGGVRGIRLVPGDRMVGMGTIFPEAHLLTVTENGFGKLSRVSKYPLHTRGGKGVLAHRVTGKTGEVVAAMLVPPSQHLIIISANGIIIRMSVDEEIPLKGRATQGVHLNKLDLDDRVVSVACVHREEDGGGEGDMAE